MECIPTSWHLEYRVGPQCPFRQHGHNPHVLDLHFPVCPRCPNIDSSPQVSQWKPEEKLSQVRRE